MTGPTPRPGILDIAPYVGGESKVAGPNRTYKLSSNEGAFGPPPAAMAAYAALAADLHRYPDGGAAALRDAIGTRFGLDPQRIVCGAGSDDIIYQLILAYGGAGTELVMSRHGFSIYAIAAGYAGCTVVKTPERALTADVDAMLAAVSPATRLVFLANPNNPTGTLVPDAELRRLRAGLPTEALLVLDGAYAEYVDRPDYDPGTALVDAATADGTGNVVMTRTFSKIFGLGGLRLGWCYAPPAVVDVLNRVRSPFQLQPRRPGGRYRGAPRTRLGRGRARPQHALARLAHGRAARRRARRPPERGQLHPRGIPRRSRRPGRRRPPQIPRHHRPAGRILRPAAMPAHYHRHREECGLVAETLA